MFFMVLVTAAAAYWWWWAYKKREQLLKYEFENRTAGGVVEFKTYEEAKKHDNLKGRLEAQIKMAAFLTIVVGLITFIGYKLAAGLSH